jgi:chromate transporter
MPPTNTPPHESYPRLFLRFLHFGFLAWGGPVAQIAMIREELVEREAWISRERFNRVLGVYQVLPGPEATELCVYFGMQARGRVGGLLAGLGFMLPGFVLMFALSWFYVTYGMRSPLFAAVFYGAKAAVVALIIRAIWRIGSHALTDRWLWAIAIAAAVASWFGVFFILILITAGVLYALLRRGSPVGAAHLLLPFAPLLQAAAPVAPSVAALFIYGLRTGLLTFGGAYTAIPFLQYDAVAGGADGVGGWMTDAQFLDGLALSGILPAPLIIFSTFVGYVGGGPLGALVMTVGVFLPAFAFTLIGHHYVERLVENPAAHAFLDGVTAAVVGLIAVTAVDLFRAGVVDWPTALIFVLALLAALRLRAKSAVAGIMGGAGVLGWVFYGG